MNTEQALASAQAQKLEALVDPLPDVLKDEAKDLMDPTLSAVAGVSIKSAATQTLAAHGAPWQFPVSRSRSRQRVLARKRSRSRSRKGRNGKSRSRRRSRSSQRSSRRRSRTRSNRNHRNHKRQTGGMQPFRQLGGWEWFGWFKSSSSPPVYPNSPQPVQDPVPIGQSTEKASDSRILKMLKRLLFSALFIKTVYYAANAWGLASEISDDFMAEVRYMTMEKLFTKQAQIHWGAASGLNGYIMMLQGEYIKAVASLTAATAFVTVSLLRKRYKAWRKRQFEELEELFLFKKAEQAADRVKRDEKARTTESLLAPAVIENVPQFPAAILADTPPASALDTSSLDKKELERLEHLYTVAACKNDLKGVENILQTPGFANFYNLGLVRPFLLKKKHLPTPTDVPTDVYVVQRVLRAILNAGITFPMSNLVFAYVLETSGNDEYDANPRRPTVQQRTAIINMLVHDETFDFLSRLQKWRLCNRTKPDMQRLGFEVACLDE